MANFDDANFYQLVEDLKDIWLDTPDFAMQVNYPIKGKQHINYPYEELDDELAELLIINYWQSSYPEISDLDILLNYLFNYWVERSALVMETKSFYEYLRSIALEPSYIETVYPHLTYDLTPHYLDDNPDDLIKLDANAYFERLIHSTDFSEMAINLDFDMRDDKYRVINKTDRREITSKSSFLHRSAAAIKWLNAPKTNVISNIIEDFF